jgi:hypothetical protein
MASSRLPRASKMLAVVSSARSLFGFNSSDFSTSGSPQQVCPPLVSPCTAI